MGKTAKPKRIESGFLNLAGEYRVCSELQKREIFATITYGQHKGIDIFVIDDRLNVSLRVEVKTSQKARFVTGISQKKHYVSGQAPDVWVLVLIKPASEGSYIERFFVLTHSEICAIQKRTNARYARKYFERHQTQPDTSRGVDNVPLSVVEPFENQWEKIRALLTKQAESANPNTSPSR